jgi:hypothetical protein
MKYYLVLLFIFSLVFGLKWREEPIYTDEYASVFIAHGLAVDVFQAQSGYSLPQYAAMTKEELAQENTVQNVIQYNQKDGGSGLPHYVIAHVFSLFLGNKLGIINTLRLLSVCFSLLLVISFYSFTKQIWGKEIGLLTSILLIFLLTRYGDYIRTYPLSNLFIFLYFSQFYQIIQKIISNQKITFSNYLLFSLYALLLPFCHFFNACYLGVSLFVGLYFSQIVRLRLLAFVPSLIILVLALLIFSIYYFSNEAGRAYQATANEYWYHFSQQFGTPQNQWLPPATMKHLAIKNIELALITTGLDFRMIAQHWQIRYFGWLLLPMAICLFLLGKFLYQSFSLQAKWGSILGVMCLSYLFTYILFINVLCLIFRHTTPLNSSWYYFSLIPFYALTVGYVLKNLRVKHLKIGFYLYLVLVMVNTLVAAWRWQTHENGAKHDKKLLEKLNKWTSKNSL